MPHRDALKTKKRSFITVDHITFAYKDRLMLPKQLLANSFGTSIGPFWAEMESRQSTFVRALWGGDALLKGKDSLPFFADSKTEAASSFPKEAIGYVSFETHHRLMEHEEMQEDLRAFANKKRTK